MTTIKPTKGALLKIVNNVKIFNPVVQLISFKYCNHPSSKQVQLQLSDGQFKYSYCCVQNGRLMRCIELNNFPKFSIVRLKNFFCRSSPGNTKKPIFILDMELIVPGTQLGHVYGEPELLENYLIAKNNPSSPQASETTSPYDQLASNALNRPTDDEALVVSSTVMIEPENSVFGVNNSTFNSLNIKEDQICPIGQINPYNKRWIIRGRVASKSEIKNWSNSRTEGIYFIFSLADDSGEIKVTAFQEACEKFFNLIEFNKVFILSKAFVKTTKNKTSIDHYYELTLHKDSLIIPGDEFNESCPQLDYKFIKISHFENIQNNSLVDIIAVCSDPGKVSTLTHKSSRKELKKREIILLDDSETEIQLTIWNTDAENFNGSKGSVIVARKVRVTDFNGKSLCTVASTIIQVDPDLPAAQELRTWYQTKASDLIINSLTEKSYNFDNLRKDYLNAINYESLNKLPAKCMAIASKATISQTGKITFYWACPGECKKKLVEMNDGTYKCDKCNTIIIEPKHRLIFNFFISDATNSIWVTAFHEQAEQLIGMSADKLAELQEKDEDEFDFVLGSINFQTFNFGLRSKIYNYQEESRLRTSVTFVNPIKIEDYCHELTSEIHQMIKPIC